jgi:hypothetical protein
MAVGAATASANTSAATTNAYSAGYSAGSSNASTANANAAVANANATAANANAAAANANVAAAGAANVTYEMGAVYAVLPAGCITPNVQGKAYYLCGNTWFSAAYGANGVYYKVVLAP